MLRNLDSDTIIPGCDTNNWNTTLEISFHIIYIFCFRKLCGHNWRLIVNLVPYQNDNVSCKQPKMTSTNQGVTPIIMEYNQTTLKEMMSSLSDCFEILNQTDTVNEEYTGNSSSVYVSIQPLNNLNCSLYNETTSIESITNDTSPKCSDTQEYFSWSYALVGTLFQSIILVVGVLGNVLTCTVVQRTRSMHTTTNCYLGWKLRTIITILVSINIIFR